MLLQNPFFWLGEIGLVLTLISCIVFVHQLRHEKPFQVFAFWFAAVMALATLVHPAIFNPDHSVPVTPYLNRLAVGTVFASRCYHYLKGAGRSANPAEIQMGMKVLRWATVFGTAVLMYVAFKIRNR